MSTKDDGGPAFPVIGAPGAGEDYGGMSLRDYFAGKALQGFAANPAVFAVNGMTGWALVNADEKKLSDYCLFLADAMLEARK